MRIILFPSSTRALCRAGVKLSTRAYGEDRGNASVRHATAMLRCDATSHTIAVHGALLPAHRRRSSGKPGRAVRAACRARLSAGAARGVARAVLQPRHAGGSPRRRDRARRGNARRCCCRSHHAPGST
ncbi:hypothetical protein AB5I41_12815 [Sphingomonas sp. MMS24-JH45]